MTFMKKIHMYLQICFCIEENNECKICYANDECKECIFEHYPKCLGDFVYCHMMKHDCQCSDFNLQIYSMYFIIEFSFFMTCKTIIIPYQIKLYLFLITN
jgi:hypothetical protein